MDQPQHRTAAQVDLRAAGLALLTAAFWGANPTAVLFSVDVFPPVTVAALRFLLAALFMLAWNRWEGAPLGFARKHLPLVLGAGVLLFVQIATFNIGVSLTSASHATLIINTFVFWVVAIEHFTTRGSVMNGLRWLGLLAAFCGVALVIVVTSGDAQSRDQPTLTGDLVMLGSAVLLAIKIVYTKHAVRRIAGGTLILWHDLIGVLLFTLYAACLETVDWSGATWTAALAIVYQGMVVAGLCFAIQAWLLKHHSATQISMFSFTTPLFGVLFGVLVRGDQLSWWLLLAALLIAVGIVMVNLQATGFRRSR